MKRNKKAQSKEIHALDFFFEMGMMKKIEHCGSKFAGIKHPDTIGEHSCRGAQIGMVLAEMEGADPLRVTAMCVFHDIGEVRVGDTHRIASKYIETKTGEREAMIDQTENLPSVSKNSIRKMWDEFHAQETLDSKIARDAELVETMLQAKEYMDNGHLSAKRWIENGSTVLYSATAKKLARLLQKRRSDDWWDHLNTVYDIEE